MRYKYRLQDFLRSEIAFSKIKFKHPHLRPALITCSTVEGLAGKKIGPTLFMAIGYQYGVFHFPRFSSSLEKVQCLLITDISSSVLQVRFSKGKRRRGCASCSIYHQLGLARRRDL